MHLIDHGRSHIEKTYKRPFSDRFIRDFLSSTLSKTFNFRVVAILAQFLKPFNFLFPKKIKEMVNHNGPVIFDCQVDPNENCFPMIPSGKPHNQMILGPKDKDENKITGKGKALV